MNSNFSKKNENYNSIMNSELLNKMSGDLKSIEMLIENFNENYGKFLNINELKLSTEKLEKSNEIVNHCENQINYLNQITESATEEITEELFDKITEELNEIDNVNEIPIEELIESYDKITE